MNLEEAFKKVFKKILKFYNDDYEHVLIWFCTTHPGLGDPSPVEMIITGRSEKLFDFIQSSLEENHQ